MNDALSRRELMRFFGAAALVGCGAPLDDSPCPAIPGETAGPFPGDGTNGPNVLELSGVVRADLRASFGGSTTVAAGVPLTLTMTITDRDCAPRAGVAVYVWHCDREGRYSLYSSGVTGENYLRGVQVSGADGVITFQTIFPGCYAGRWPHIHVEIYASAAAATSGQNAIATSQLALPKAPCDEVYATAGYEQSVTSLKPLSIATDGVFADGATLETPAMSGSVGAGYTATLQVAVG